MMEIGSRGSAWNPKHLANLDVSKTLYVVKHNYRPCSLGKLRKRVSQTALELRIQSGIPKGRLQGVTQLLSRPHFSATDHIQRSIRNDAVEPRRETLRRIEPVDCAPGTDKSVLNRIFRIFVNSHDRPCNEVRATLVQADKPCEGILIARASRFGQRAFLIWDTHLAA
jgi:hypothetical protein